MNALTKLKSKKKTLTNVVDNSNNYISHSILSGKSETFESGFGFIGIGGDKVLLYWVRFPNQYIYIDLTDISIHFLEGTVFSGTTDNIYGPDNIKVLKSVL